MNTYGERLAYAMLLADNMSQSELARQSNVKQQSIQYLIDKGKGSSHTATFARILRVRPEWLAKGTGPMREEEPSNVSPGPPPTPIEQSILDLLRGLTPEQQDDAKRQLEETNRKNEEIFKALSRKSDK